LNDLPVEEVNQMVYFDTECHSVNTDITLVLGFEESSNAASILLCRFHKLKAFYGKKRTVRTLFKDLHDLLDEKTMKLERCREGGSSGRIRYSKELRMMLHTPMLHLGKVRG